MAKILHIVSPDLSSPKKAFHDRLTSLGHTVEMMEVYNPEQAEKAYERAKQSDIHLVVLSNLDRLRVQRQHSPEVRDTILDPVNFARNMIAIGKRLAVYDVGGTHHLNMFDDEFPGMRYLISPHGPTAITAARVADQFLNEPYAAADNYKQPNHEQSMTVGG